MQVKNLRLGVFIASAIFLIAGVGLGIDKVFLQAWVFIAISLSLLVFGLFFKSFTNHDDKQNPTRDEKISDRAITLATIFLTILFIIQPMELCPVWNGDIPAHRNQYELLADSILRGHIYIDYKDVDPKLEQMENPYDPDARKEQGVFFHWDHAYYKGKYYMYFGVVPVFLVFIPYRVIFRQQLTSYKATRIFTGMYILGVFALVGLFRKLFFKNMSKKSYLLLCTAISFATSWYFSSIPGLYSNPISSGVCLEVWSLYFFFKAVYQEEKENKQILFATIGSILGALTFGCRPTIALANIIVIPLLVIYLKNKEKIKPGLIFKLIGAAMPYFVVLGLLFWYNYARFENPFEFGQSYQMTVADQHLYVSPLANLDIKKIITELCICLFDITEKTYNGLLFEYPIFYLIVFLIDGNVKSYLKEKKLFPVVMTMIGTMFGIIISQIMASPFLLERYKFDYLWVIGIFAALIIGCIYNMKDKKFYKSLSTWANFFCICTIFISISYFLFPHDSNYTQYVTSSFLYKLVHFFQK